MSTQNLDLVYVHFAKAGGTSIAHTLGAYYGRQIFWDTAHDPCNPSHDIHEPPRLTGDVSAVMGHIRADRYINFPTRVLATFLRDPVDKLISVYYFWKTLPRGTNPDHIRFLADRPSLLDHARATAGIAYPAYFSDFDMRDFDFIGFHDRRAEDLGTLASITGFPICHKVWLNVTPASEERDAALANSDLLADLRRALAEDIDFYESVRSDRLKDR